MAATPRSTTGTGKPRSAALDFLRGIAILLVIGRHPVIEPHRAGLLRPLAGFWNRFGWAGVDLFFVLSGFLVGGLLFQELRARGRLDVRRFLIRRGFKIWPSYFLFLGFVFLALLIGKGESLAGAARAILPNCLHIQNYWDTPRLHTWSLAVEEHFYLALPLLLLLVTRRHDGAGAIPAIPITAALLAAACLCLRIAANTGRVFPEGRWVELYQAPTHLRIDSLFFGVLLAYLYHFRPHVLTPFIRHRPALLAAGLALIAPMCVLRVEESRFVCTFGFTLLYLGSGCLLLALVHAPSGGRIARFLASAPSRLIAFVGYYSYSIYLWHPDLGHNPVRFLVERAGLISHGRAEVVWLAATAVYVAAAVLAGITMGAMIERPALALRDRLFPTRAAALPPEPPPDAAPVESLAVVETEKPPEQVGQEAAG